MEDSARRRKSRHKHHAATPTDMDEVTGKTGLIDQASKAFAASMSGNAKHPALRLLMRAMFRPVFGHSFPFRADLEPVQFASNDGSRLEGAVVEVTGESRGAMVLCHPFLK